MDESGSAGFVIIVAILAFYFLPAIIGKIRNCAHEGVIFAINFVFGWTVLGWIAALIWAIVEKPEDWRPTPQHRTIDPRQ